MAKAVGLCGAAALALLGASIASACGSETIDLLEPPLAAGGAPSPGLGGGSGGPQAGEGGAAGATSRGGESSAGDGGAAWGGRPGTGGEEGTEPCFGPGCVPCRDDLQCPDPWRCSEQLGYCVECDQQDDCPADFRCNVAVGRCTPRCDRFEACNEGRVCDAELQACVPCTVNEQCLNDLDQDTRYCRLGRCVQCYQHEHCSQGARNLCSNWRCVQCITGDDCGDAGRCNSGRCESP
jgi:hypothetical protein